MPNLNTNLTKKTIRSNERFKELPLPITIADVISNAESLFGNDKQPHQHIVMDIIIMCEKNKPLKELEDYILKNICKN